MLKKDEVSKYTVPKNALDMLEWTPNGQTYTAKDIPQLIKKGFKPMTDSNIQPPANTTGEVLADGTVGWPTETPPVTEETAVPNPVPGTEVTQSPGLIPETTTQIPGYDPNTSTAPGEYDPASANVDTAVPPTDYAAAVDHQVNTMPSAPPDMPVAPPETHNELMQDPAYAVHVHEQQLNRICEMLEEVCQRVIAIEDKLNVLEAQHHHMEEEIHFQGTDPNNPINDYPEVSQHQAGGSPGLTV